MDASGLHPSTHHIDTVRETIREVFAPSGAILEYVALVTQFEQNGPLHRRFAETENYVFEVIDALKDLSNILFELGNEVDIHGKGWGTSRVNQVLGQVRTRWPSVTISCSSGREPDGAYGNYIYPRASWANIHYPRRDFPELTFGWPTFPGPIVDDEPEFYPRTTVEAYVRHFELIQQQSGFMTVHSETGFITDPKDDRDIPFAPRAGGGPPPRAAVGADAPSRLTCNRGGLLPEN